MIKLTTEQRNKLLYIALGTVVACVVIGFVFISPQLSNKKRNKAKITEAKTKFQEADGLRKDKDKVQEELNEATETKNKIENKLAPKASLYQWTLRTVNDFLSKTNYNVAITQLSTPIQGEVGAIPNFPYAAGFFKLTCQAYYHNFGKFVTDFENEYPYFRLQKLEIKRIAVEPGKASAGASVEDREQLEFRMELVVLISKLSD